jgi:deoxyribonuclease-4
MTTKSSPRYFGAHVSASGALENALINGRDLGVNTIQLHPSPPQRWNSAKNKEGTETRFNELRKDSGVEKVFFHAIYLINLANPDPQKFHLSKLSLVHHLDLMDRISGDGVIFHVGSMKDQESDDVGYAQVSQGINWILENSPNKARLILEVAAGSGDIIGDKLEELSRIYEGVTNKERVGFGLDSQHMWASGYNLQTDLEKIVENIDSAFGIDKVWSVHLNDSKTECCSKKDRHENLGDGLIGLEALTKFINHPKLRHIPFILETPALKDMETAKGEVERLRAIIK